MIVFLALFLNISFSSEYSSFYGISDRSTLNAFAKDLSAFTSSSVFYSARTLGFSGFSLNYKTNYLISPSDKNKIFKKSKPANLSLIQFETGLPYRVDTFIRGGGNDGYNFIGGGIRYGLKNVTDEKYGVNLSFSAYTHMGIYRDFYLLSFGSRVALSMKISKMFVPFIGSGFDRFKLNIKSHSDPSLIGSHIYGTTYATICGMRVKMGWFNLAGVYELYSSGANSFGGSVGVRF